MKFYQINKHMKRLDEQITLAASNVDENVLVTNLFESDSESRPQSALCVKFEV